MSVLTNMHLVLPNIRAMDRTPAVYLLRHVPSKRVYVGFTRDLRVRLHWWMNRLSSAANTGSVPAAMRALLDQTGYDPSQWTFAVLDQGPFVNRHTSEERFGHYLSRLQAQYPTLLLNRPPSDRTKPIKTYNAASMLRARGTSPRSWLKGRLGLGDPMPEQMPAHGWDIDPYVLTPGGHFNTTFAEYLFRSMLRTHVPHRKNGVYNPSAEAIRELFEVWRRDNAHDPLLLKVGVPLTVEQAVLVPPPLPVPEHNGAPRVAPRGGDVPASREEGTINAPMPPVDNTFVPAPLSDEDSLILDRFGL